MLQAFNTWQFTGPVNLVTDGSSLVRNRRIQLVQLQNRSLVTAAFRLLRHAGVHTK
jgi:hypothetical protein